MKSHLDYIAARDLLLNRVAPLGTERVMLTEAYGRVLARDLLAQEDVPAFDRSPYDGYTVRSADTVNASEKHPITLRVVEEIPAGAVPEKEITAGTAAKILTGAPVPSGADAVINYEATEFTAESVTLFAPLEAGKNVVRRGEDVRQGALLAAAGTVIDPSLCGTLAAQGVMQPEVYRVPRVAVFSTGNEVLEPDAPMHEGCIRNSNGYTLCAALKEIGLSPVYMGIARDDAAEIAEKLEKALDTCDAVVTSGGVSVGDYDLTPAAMAQCGAEMLFRGVALKPGMACAYGMKNGKLICALSGNPASSLINLIAVAVPALKKLAGRANPLPQEIEATLRDGFSKRSGVTRLLHGRIVIDGGRAELVPSSGQGNVMISRMVGSNAFGVIPAGSGPIAAGTALKCFLVE